MDSGDIFDLEGTGVSQPEPVVAPDMTDAQAVAAAGGTQLAPQASGWPSLLQMLGLGGGGGSSAAPVAPSAQTSAATPAGGALPQGAMNPLLGLGVTGQKTQQAIAGSMPVSGPKPAYQLPAAQNTRAGASILGFL